MCRLNFLKHFETAFEALYAVVGENKQAFASALLGYLSKCTCACMGGAFSDHGIHETNCCSLSLGKLFFFSTRTAPNHSQICSAKPNRPARLCQDLCADDVLQNHVGEVVSCTSSLFAQLVYCVTMKSDNSTM